LPNFLGSYHYILQKSRSFKLVNSAKNFYVMYRYCTHCASCKNIIIFHHLVTVIFFNSAPSPAPPPRVYKNSHGRSLCTYILYTFPISVRICSQGCQVAVTVATFHKCSRRSWWSSRGKLVAVSSRQVAVEGQKIHKSSREKFYLLALALSPSPVL